MLGSMAGMFPKRMTRTAGILAQTNNEEKVHFKITSESHFAGVSSLAQYARERAVSLLIMWLPLGHLSKHHST